MAHLVPSERDAGAVDDARAPELQTLRQLRRELSADFTVFHGVHWAHEHRTFTVYGEIDFVVLGPSGRVVVVEQKNGQLEETDRGLVKHYAGGSKRVADQLNRSIHHLREKFRRSSRARSLDADYMIVCPDYRIRAVHAAALDRSRVVGSDEMDDLPARLARLFEGDEADEDQRAAVQAFLEQQFSIAPDIHAHVRANERTFTQLSEGLADTIERIEMSPLRLRVRGVAGCGKSTVALRLFKQATQAGKRPLLICFNRPLKERLAAAAGAGGLVETWYGFGVEFLKSRDDPPDFGKATEQPDFWDRVFERVLGHSIPDSWLFDPVIVDEGQDFEPHWLETLRCFVDEDADFIWLEDSEQDIRGADAVQLPDFIGFRADGNYRTPQSIARFVRDVLRVSFEAKNPLPGLGVAVHGYANADDQRKRAGHVIKELVGRGFKHADIVLLSLKSSRRSTFTDVKRVGNFTLKSFKGTYDLLGNQVFTDGQIQFESIYRFKGQQAAAIILIDVDGDDSDPDRWRRLLYSGMTRATVRLEILAARDNPHNEPLFEAAD